MTQAQSPIDGFDPNANGMVRVVVLQPDGKILLGGDFTSIAPNGGAAVPRNRIARLNPDGTLDATFDPNANNTVNSIAVQGDGKILVGGSFNGTNSIGGQNRDRIARLDATTGLADSFDPSANSSVFAIAVQADGRILVGGFFDSIGGESRNRIARLDPITGLADSFDPNANGPEIFSIVVQRDGQILAGGFFTSIGGQTRHNIARLDPKTGLADSFNPNASDEVRCIAVQADGKILAGGFFTLIGGQSRNSLARLDAVNGAADSFNPDPSGGVFAISVQADGRILVGGEFFNVGGQSRHQIARLDSTTGLADSFDPSANSTVNSIAVQADGKILIGGGFTTLTPNGGGTIARNRIARLETDGGADRTLSITGTGDYIVSTAVQPDGRILVGGSFSNILGVTRNNIARLNRDGTLDLGFDPNANGLVYAMAVQPDGKILAGGDYTSIGGQTRNGLARLDPTTGLSDSFNPNAAGQVMTILIQTNGKILAGGLFGTIGGQPRNNIARLDPVTGAADSFNPNANSFVYSMAEQADGKILVGGRFVGGNSIGGQTRNNIARLDPVTGLADSFNPNANADVASIVLQTDGMILVGGNFSGINSIGGALRNRIARLSPVTGAADSFNPNANNFLRTIVLQPDGKILASGAFTSIGGQTRNRVARLDPAIGAADSFDPNVDNEVSAIVPQPDGKILIGGRFSSIGGQPRPLLGRVTNDVAARQELSATENTITWNRGGSSPNLLRATFESSSNGVNYSFLGNGTSAESNWTLTGLNLPAGQNLYLRARGYYRAGHFNSSESMTESVLYGPPGTPTPSPTPCPECTPTPTPEPPTPTPSPSPTPTPAPIPEVGAPVFTMSTNDGFVVNNQPVTTTFISPSLNYIGFQCDIVFDSAVAIPSPPQFLVAPAGITATGWTVSANILFSGPGLKTLRVSAFSNDGLTPLNGSGTLFLIRWKRVSINVGASTPLTWSPYPNDFEFIDIDLNGISPSQNNGLITIVAGGTPTPVPIPVGISGTVSYCSNPSPAPVPDVKFTLSGSGSGTALSDGSGTYGFSSLIFAGTYIVTPSKSTLASGFAGINTVDVLAVQRHFLNVALIPPGCRLTAADVNHDYSITTIDVIAIQRFYLGITTGLADVGRYQFSPQNQPYIPLTSNQTNQNYDVLIFGDVAPPFVTP